MPHAKYPTAGIPADTTSQVLTTLSTPFRRWLLVALAERSPLDRDTAVLAFAADTDRDIDVVSIEAHHTHLPRLKHLGLILVSDDGAAQRGLNSDTVAAFIRVLDGNRVLLWETWP